MLVILFYLFIYNLPSFSFN